MGYSRCSVNISLLLRWAWEGGPLVRHFPYALFLYFPALLRLQRAHTSDGDVDNMQI